MRLNYLILLLFICFETNASSSTIKSLLNDIKNKSLEIKIAENNFKYQSILNERELNIFEPSSFARLSYTNQDTPPTSPFAPSNSLVSEFEAGMSKIWKSGIESNVTYLLRDSTTSFPSRADFAFIAPTLQVQLKTNIFQDLLNDKFEHIVERNKLDRSSIDVDTKLKVKSILIQALLDFAFLLEQKDEFNLQEKLCSDISMQIKNLEAKIKRSSISKREYFLGLKEQTNCLAKIESLNKNYIQNLETFESKYLTSFKKYNHQIDLIFQEAQIAYNQAKLNNKKPNIEEQDDIQSLHIKLESLKAKQMELEAAAKSSVSLELRSGLTGLDDTFSQASNELTKMEYKFVYVGLRMELPLRNRDAVAQATANMYNLEALKYQKEFSTKQKEARLDILNKSLEKDFSIYSNYQKTVELSKNVFKEANRDFVNGRIDFNSLMEFSKALSIDQKTLSAHRIKLIISVVEYLDFYHYFDQYLE